MKYYFKESSQLLQGELYNSEGNAVYVIENKTIEFPEIHLSRNGEDLGYVSTEIKILFREYYLYIGGEKKETINPLFTLFLTQLTLMKSHWSVNGVFKSLNYNIKNHKGNTVAVISKGTDLDRYCIDITDEDNEVFIILIIMMINLYNRGAANALK